MSDCFQFLRCRLQFIKVACDQFSLPEQLEIQENIVASHALIEFIYLADLLIIRWHGFAGSHIPSHEVCPLDQILMALCPSLHHPTSFYRALEKHRVELAY
ncbi:hypothetical protein SK128_003779 [Halocaridina rubra]|uniref:Uncharacterized protein n=1 Tax=Halocaridina rubra TaxID=373956 RepID=A0AAN9ACQ7_HALRR